MGNPVPEQRGGPPPRNRLESWLRRKVRAGAFKALPPYSPLGDRGDQCPDQYARALLARMRADGGDPRAIERARDDGRAFRSWAEAVRALAI